MILLNNGETRFLWWKYLIVVHCLVELNRLWNLNVAVLTSTELNGYFE